MVFNWDIFAFVYFSCETGSALSQRRLSLLVKSCKISIHAGDTRGSGFRVVPELLEPVRLAVLAVLS